MPKSRGLYSMTSWEKKCKHEDIQLIIGTDKIVEPHKVANAFANYFSSIGNTLENNLSQTDLNPLSYIDRNIF